ncbi:hypothetical protein P4H42_17465 [Paenibacillus macerans]|uniref:hypothetical protein n=1 Tax=Paenibacillus macerans TaxID=44252 RepID=UPI002DB92332|nr:hypothetical protein [Paenibacillus macerans]MEC0331402.1 hypothetical protein [Paenibacillus macerans]
MRIGKAGGLVGRSISAGQTLCMIIPFDQEAEKKIHSGEEDTFRRRRYIQRRRYIWKKWIWEKQTCSRSLKLFKIIDRLKRREASLRREKWGKTQEKMKRP